MLVLGILGSCFYLIWLFNYIGTSTFIWGEVTIRDSFKTQLGVISLELKLCPFRVSAFEWLQYLLLFLHFLNKDASKLGHHFTKACLYFPMLSIGLKEICIFFLCTSFAHLDHQGLSNTISSVLDKEGDFAKPYGTITKGLCSGV